jgi:lysylphosphatidylglycerol synthetase-like protein (DUF2156 family)
MIKILKSALPVLVLVLILLSPCLTLAGDFNPIDKLDKVGNESGFNTANKGSSLPAQIGRVIASILTLLGIVFLGLMVYAGIFWMIAAGDESKVTKSKDTMRRAVIGLIIVVGSYAISQFVVYSIVS